MKTCLLTVGLLALIWIADSAPLGGRRAFAEEELPTQNVHRVLVEVKKALAGIPIQIQWIEAATGRLTMRARAADEATLDRVGPALKGNAYLRSRATVPERGYVRGDVQASGDRLEAEFFLHFKPGAGPPEPRGDLEPRTALDSAGQEVGLRVLYASRERAKADEDAKRTWFKQDFEIEAFDAEGGRAEPMLPQLERLLERLGANPRLQPVFVGWHRAESTPERPDPGDALSRVRIHLTSWAPLEG